MLNSIPSYTYTTICLSSHVVRHLSSFHFLATINITIKCAYKYFDVHIFLFSLVLKPRVKLLGHRIGVDLTLKETAKYLSSYFKIPLAMYKKILLALLPC